MNEKLSDVVTVLDCDLNLYLFIVNEQKKSFEIRADTIKLDQKLKIDSQWLKFYKKELRDFNTYK